MLGIYKYYKKAFDTVEHSRVIQALTKQGVEPKYSRILRKLYNETYAKVTTEREGDEFKIEREEYVKETQFLQSCLQACWKTYFRN